MNIETANKKAKEITTFGMIFGCSFKLENISDGISYLKPKESNALAASTDQQVIDGIRCYANKEKPFLDYEKAICATIKRWY